MDIELAKDHAAGMCGTPYDRLSLTEQIAVTLFDKLQSVEANLRDRDESAREWGAMYDDQSAALQRAQDEVSRLKQEVQMQKDDYDSLISDLQRTAEALERSKASLDAIKSVIEITKW